MPPPSPTPLSSHGRLALFIDGSNFYHTIRELGIHVDYRRLHEYFAAQGDLRRATYYTALLDNNPPDWLVRLTDWLSYNGYRVVTKPARTFRRRVHTDVGSEHWVLETQGNVDVELAVDMLTLAPHLDTLILFSGDGDSPERDRGRAAPGLPGHRHQQQEDLRQHRGG